jgi:hypothetical protein
LEKPFLLEKLFIKITTTPKMMKINRPYVMVASVGSDKVAPMNKANQSAGWKMVARKIKKDNAKKTRVQVSNPSRINQNSMKVIIKTAAKNDEPPKLKEVNAPYKPHRVEAFKSSFEARESSQGSNLEEVSKFEVSKNP